MNDPDDPKDDGGNADAMRDLIKRSLSTDPIAKASPNLLAGVQRRIRRRSRGKFFGDGWSTTQTRASHAVIALVTLLVVALAYYVLGPMDVR